MWRHDTWAEEHKLDNASCIDRKSMWDKYCGADDSKMVYIAKDQQISQASRDDDSDVIAGSPSAPGCYMRMPTKCPKHPMKTGMWRRDSWAEEHALDEAGCS